jgi:hypothetical protein
VQAVLRRQLKEARLACEAEAAAAARFKLHRDELAERLGFARAGLLIALPHLADPPVRRIVAVALVESGGSVLRAGALAREGDDGGDGENELPGSGELRGPPV